MFRIVKETTWHPSKMKEVTYHPSCLKPDAHSPEDYQRLLADVKENGIRVPILVQEDTLAVVGGRHRIRAAKEAGCPIPVHMIEINDAECWSLSRSELCHRNLSATRAAVLYQEMKDEEQKAIRESAKENAKEKDGEEEKKKDAKPAKKSKAKKGKAAKGEGKKAEKEAKEAGVSTALMERVKKVKAKGVPALWKAMDAGDVSANDAAFIVDFDHDIQKKALALVKDDKCKTLKAAKTIIDKEAKAAAGPALKDGKGNEVPKGLVKVFEDRELFALLREDLKSVGKRYNDLTKRESGKYLPKNLGKHILDAAEACDIYQPFAVAENADGWINKRSAK